MITLLQHVLLHTLDAPILQINPVVYTLLWIPYPLYFEHIKCVYKHLFLVWMSRVVSQMNESIVEQTLQVSDRDFNFHPHIHDKS